MYILLSYQYIMQEYILQKRCILPVKSGLRRDYEHIIYIYNRKRGQVFNVEYIKELLTIVSLQCDTCFKKTVKQIELKCKTHNYCFTTFSIRHITSVGGYL